MCTYSFLITFCNMHRGSSHNSKVSDNVEVSFEERIGLCKFTATKVFLLLPVRRYRRDGEIEKIYVI